MRRGEPKPILDRIKRAAEKRQEGILSKCHPAIFEVAQLWKESIEALKTLPAGSPQEVRASIYARLDKRLKEIKRRYSGPVRPAPGRFAAQIIFSESALKSESDGQGVVEWIHWERHRRPLKQDAKKARKREWEASRRIQRTVTDLEQLRCGRGPIADFKGGLEHASIFEVLWGFGIERLTGEELADFFNYYCPCGSEHDPDALKKQRTRFQKDLSESIGATAV